jgi:hypothetical protein
MPNPVLHATDPSDFRVLVISDDTYTVATIDYVGERIGRGEAKRRPGETRDVQLGAYLALSRALRDAARYYGRQASERMPK